MKKISIFFLFLLLFIMYSPLSSHAELLNPNQEETIIRLMERSNINALSVIGVIVMIDGLPNKKELSAELMEELTSDFVRLKDYKFNIVVRSKDDIKRILDEFKFQLSDLVNPSSAKQIGKFLGVDAIVMGKLQKNGLYIQIIQVTNGRIIWSDKVGNGKLAVDAIERSTKNIKDFLVGTWYENGRLDSTHFSIRKKRNQIEVYNFYLVKRYTMGWEPWESDLNVMKFVFEDGELRWSVFIPEKTIERIYPLPFGLKKTQTSTDAAETLLFKVSIDGYDMEDNILWVQSKENGYRWMNYGYFEKSVW